MENYAAYNAGWYARYTDERRIAPIAPPPNSAPGSAASKRWVAQCRKWYAGYDACATVLAVEALED